MLKLLQVNIERGKHYPRIASFMKAQQPHVVTMQEVLEPDVPLLKESLGLAHVAFSPMYIHPADGEARVVGVMLGSTQAPLEDVRDEVYYGPGNGREYVEPEKQTEPEARTRFAALLAHLNHQGETYPVATTHFLWTPDGEANANQREACTNLLANLKRIPRLVLAGDFNAPRGKEIFTRLAAAYADNIPPHYITSLDKSLHRAGNRLPDYMVDGLFTTPHFQAENVQLHFGVSDHAAVTAIIKPA